LATGEPVAKCRYLRRYDAMFDGRSSIHQRVHDFCAKELPLTRDPERDRRKR
jgi:hypothetical protein